MTDFLSSPKRTVTTPTTDELRRLFREEVVVEWSWEKVELGGSAFPGSQGQEEGWRAQCEEHPGKLFHLKPGRYSDNEGLAPAAREKIASDLAFELNINVPPVVLLRRNERGRCKEVCASLHMSQEMYPWGQVELLLGYGDLEASDILERAEEQASSAYVFDAWVAQYDHGSADSMCNNILASVLSSGSSLWFIDYASSLGSRESGPKKDWFSTMTKNHFPNFLRKRLNEKYIKDSVERIESMGEESITSIVHRIPEDFLCEEEKRIIEKTLLSRRTKLQNIINLPVEGIVTELLR